MFFKIDLEDMPDAASTVYWTVEEMQSQSCTVKVSNIDMQTTTQELNIGLETAFRLKYEEEFLGTEAEVPKMEEVVVCYLIDRTKGTEAEQDRETSGLKSYKGLIYGAIRGQSMGTAKVRFTEHKYADTAIRAWQRLSWIVTDIERGVKVKGRTICAEYSNKETFFKGNEGKALNPIDSV